MNAARFFIDMYDMFRFQPITFSNRNVETQIMNDEEILARRLQSRCTLLWPQGGVRWPQSTSTKTLTPVSGNWIMRERERCECCLSLSLFSLFMICGLWRGAQWSAYRNSCIMKMYSWEPADYLTSAAERLWSAPKREISQRWSRQRCLCPLSDVFVSSLFARVLRGRSLTWRMLESCRWRS